MFAIGIPVVLFAGISKAGFGSSATFVAPAILALVVPPGVALALMLPLLMIIDVAALRAYWGKWHRPSAMALSIGVVPGVAIGLVLFALVPSRVLQILIGIICLVFVASQSATALGWKATSDRPVSKPVVISTGVVAGFTGFIAHAGGPPMIMLLLRQQLQKLQFQATTVCVHWVINALKLPAYTALGLFTSDVLLLAFLLSPAALLGTWIGVRAHHWVTERQFFAFTYILLVCTGLRLLWVGFN